MKFVVRQDSRIRITKMERIFTEIGTIAVSPTF